MNPQMIADEAWTASVVEPPQIWHMARIAACREVLAGASAKPSKAELLDMHQRLIAIINQSWAEYVELVAITPQEKEGYRQVGEPTHITLSHREGAPVAQWINDNPAIAGVIGELIIPSDDTTGRPSYRFSDVFRPVDLTALPESHQCVELNDTRHTATAAVHEVTAMLLRDLERICQEAEAAGAWSALFLHSRILKNAAAEALKHLPADHYKDWNPDLPRAARLEDAPTLVDRHAATNTAQQRIATHYVAHAYGEIINAAERAHVSDVPMRNRYVLQQLRAAIANVANHLDAFNQVRIATLKMSSQDNVHSVIFRAIGKSKPVLIVIPAKDMPSTLKIA